MRSLTLGDLKRNIPNDKKNTKFDRSGYVYTEKYLDKRPDIPEIKIQEIFVKLKMMGFHSDDHILNSTKGRQVLIFFD